MLKLFKTLLTNIVVISMLVSVFAHSTPVNAAVVITVTGEEDEFTPNGRCSLREAIYAANTNAAVNNDCPAGSSTGTDQIKLPAGHYRLDVKLGGNLVIYSSMAITGAGAERTVIDGDDKDRLFWISTTSSSGSISVSINDLGLKNGNGYASRKTAGGAVLIDSYSSSAVSTLNMSNVQVLINKAESGGGVFVNDHSVFNVTSSSFVENYSAYGGGINNKGRTNINATLFVDNKVEEKGGGVMVNTGSTTITNSTFAGNISSNGGAGIASTGNVTILNSTIMQNQGVGLEIVSGKGWIKNSIIAAQKENKSNCKYAEYDQNFFVSKGYNLFDSEASRSDCKAVGSDKVYADLKVSYTLAKVGNTQVFKILSTDSPAVDNADPNQCPPRDQRNAYRPMDGDGDGKVFGCDIGAYEYPGPLNPEINWTYLPVLSR